MVTSNDREILRAQIRARGDKLSPADREALLKPYLPDPADLVSPRQSQSPQSQSQSSQSRRRKPQPRKTPIRTFVKSQFHRLVYALTHIIFGIIVRLIQAYHAVVDRILAIVYHHHRTPELIRKDVRSLKRLPQHLSVILTLRTEDDALAVLMDEVAELTAWCTCAGIAQLSVYEKTGVLKSCIPALHQIISTKLASYHGTAQQPALQLYAPHHPVHGTHTTQSSSIALLLLSSTDGRETIVDLTKTLAEMSQNGKLSPEDITPELVDAEITEITSHPLRNEGQSQSRTQGQQQQQQDLLKPEPDLLLVFGPFLKLDGYPPWQLRLTEMYCTGDRSHGLTGYGEAVEYQGFMRGLWHYAGAQMRFVPRGNARALESAFTIANFIATGSSIKYSQPLTQRYNWHWQFRRTASSNSASSTHKEALAALTRLTRPSNPPRNPSKRTPNTESRSNIADHIEKAQREAGLHDWGFTIYRCTYENDANWTEILHRYQWHISDSLEYFNGLDMLDTYQATVFEDRPLFEGASTATIRDHFQNWAMSTVQESGVSLNMIQRGFNFRVARYRFCLFVDEESLQSVLRAPIDDCINKHAFVNMLYGWWKPESIDDYSQDDLEDDEQLEDILDDGYDSIEGCTLKDVGWMKVALCDAALEGYQQMGELDEWERLYERPPGICYNISNFHARR